MTCQFKSWTISYPEEAKNYDIMYDYIELSEHINASFLLDLRKQSYSLLEKFIYDIALFHTTRMRTEINGKHVSFWFKTKSFFENKTNTAHIHYDIDDYEKRILKTTVNKPLVTAITYFNDHENPTIVSDISRTMINPENVDVNYNNTNVHISFPRKGKHIAFDSGNYYHGECNLFEPSKSSNLRMVLVVAIWEKAPLYVPFYQDELFKYLRFMNYAVPIEFIRFKKADLFLTFHEDTVVKRIVCNKYCIDKEFFNKVIEFDEMRKVYSEVLYCYRPFEQYSNFIIQHVSSNHKNGREISLVIDNTESNGVFSSTDQTELVTQSANIDDKQLVTCDNTDTCVWKMQFLNNQLLDKFIDFVAYFGDLSKQNFLFDFTKHTYTLYEKIIYDIAEFHFNRLQITEKHDKYVTFWFKSVSAFDELHIDKNLFEHVYETNKNFQKIEDDFSPIITALSYFSSSNIPTIITSVTEDMHKSKSYVNNKTHMKFIFPDKTKHIAYPFGKYYHGSCNTLLKDPFESSNRIIFALAIWNKKPARELFNANKHLLTYLKDNQLPINSKKFDKTEVIVNFNIENSIQNIKIGEEFLNNSFFEELITSKTEKQVEALLDPFSKLLLQRKYNHDVKYSIN